jgi:secondary thiamine-phosphate synthase enzyme
MHEITLKTRRRCELVDVTRQIAEFVEESGLADGLVVAFVPHTTAGITINENADPDVVHDLLGTLEELVPQHRRGYQHGEGNSDAHVKASLVGPSVTVMVEGGRLCLGTWQGIYFCEFDGPRSRRLMLKING